MLTTYQQPQLYTPAYNKQTFVALSNQIAVLDFKYIVTVSINGGTLFTNDVLQRPDGHIVYDPIELVKNYIGRNFNPTTVLSPPTIPILTGSAVGGTLAAATYYYRITALNAKGESLPGKEQFITTTGATSSVAITWTAVTGATSYRIYRGTTSLGQNVYYTSATNSFTDTGAANTAGIPNTGILEAINKAVSVEVKIKEYYTAIIQSTTTFNYTAYDACLSDSDFESYVYTNYVLSGTNVLLLSPTANNFIKIENPDVKNDVWVHFFRNSCTTVEFTHYAGGNFSFDTIFTLNIPTTNNNVYYLNVGYATLRDNGLTLANNDIVIFRIKNAGVTKYTGQYTVNEIFNNYTKYTLYFLDRQGNIQLKNFELVSKSTLAKKSNKVKLGKDVLNLTSHLYGSNSYDREDHVVSTAIETTMTVTTNWITELQSSYLKDLFDSPIVWLYDQSTYKAVSITNNSYEPKKAENENLFNLELTLDLGITETRQRGI